jgi:hypothetical protein
MVSYLRGTVKLILPKWLALVLIKQLHKMSEAQIKREAAVFALD